PVGGEEGRLVVRAPPHPAVRQPLPGGNRVAAADEILGGHRGAEERVRVAPGAGVGLDCEDVLVLRVVERVVETCDAPGAVAGRFLPIWLATGVLFIVASIIAPRTLQNTSWAYILPYMTLLAIAALGQMLVVMHAGIDLSTPGVISFGGNLIVGVSLGQDHRLALGILACLGLGAGVGLVNGILVGIVRLNPLIVTLAVGQIVLAWSLRYSRENTN